MSRILCGDCGEMVTTTMLKHVQEEHPTLYKWVMDNEKKIQEAKVYQAQRT